MIYLLVICNVFLSSISQMLLKKGADNNHTSIVTEYLNPWVVGGYAILGCTLLINVFALSKGVKLKELSIMESLSYFFVPILSMLLFKEKLSSRKIASIFLIIIGIIIFFI